MMRGSIYRSRGVIPAFKEALHPPNDLGLASQDTEKTDPMAVSFHCALTCVREAAARSDLEGSGLEGSGLGPGESGGIWHGQ